MMSEIPTVDEIKAQVAAVRGGKKMTEMRKILKRIPRLVEEEN